MKSVLKWIGIVLGVLVALLVLTVIGLVIYGQVKFKPTLSNRPLYEIQADTSPEGVARGKYLMEQAMMCTEACHTPEGGAPLSGYVESLNEGPISAVFAVPNLTPDVETGLGGWTDAEIARAIREGVDKDGVGLVVMPAFNYHVLSDKDVATMIGYLRSLEPVRNEIPPLQLNMVGKIMAAMGMFGPGSVGEPITSVQDAPPIGTTEYGGYMVKLGACSDCHGQNLAGGALPFSGPNDPFAANLTPAGQLSGWQEADFIKAVREGVKPYGIPVNEAMPRYQMTDEDLAAIFAYLKTIPPAQPKQ